jgi:hypothetical protein
VLVTSRVFVIWTKVARRRRSGRWSQQKIATRSSSPDEYCSVEHTHHVSKVLGAFSSRWHQGAAIAVTVAEWTCSARDSGCSVERPCYRTRSQRVRLQEGWRRAPRGPEGTQEGVHELGDARAPRGGIALSLAVDGGGESAVERRLQVRLQRVDGRGLVTWARDSFSWRGGGYGDGGPALSKPWLDR